MTMYNSYIMKQASSLARTQIYLTQAQQSRLATVSRRAALTKSELIRQAIDQFLDQQAISKPDDKLRRLQAIQGLWADRSDIEDPAAHVRELRKPRF